VTIANHGGEAVKILTEGETPPSFDVVFMDLQMPVMDGCTASRFIRAQPQLRHLPVIAMTAHALVEERQNCLEAGMNDHVSKPIDPDTLFATLQRWAKPLRVETADATPKPAKTAPVVILPDIEGVDVAGGLTRVAGNKRLYRSLLVQFATKQADSPAQISTAIEKGDRELAERIAHTVKGVAGNLGIGSIFDAAKKLESAIRKGDNEVPALLREFTLVLGRQFRAIQEATREVTAEQPIDQDKTAVFDKQIALETVARLRALLKSSDGDAFEAFLALENIFTRSLDGPHLKALGNAVNEFDFEGALAKLDEIADSVPK
jgi:CheY-like chemotaxis protein/HPt (histidine-containing phosphotransfer) domain-containing protein